MVRLVVYRGMGQLGGGVGMHKVVVRIVGKATGFSVNGITAQDIADCLADNGWEIPNVTYEWSFLSTSQTYKVTANVRDVHTDADVVRQMPIDLARIFTVQSTTLLSEPFVPGVNSPSSNTTTPKPSTQSQSPVINVNYETPKTNAAGDAAKSTFDLSSLGLGALSGGTVAALIFILILARR